MVWDVAGAGKPCLYPQSAVRAVPSPGRQLAIDYDTLERRFAGGSAEGQDGSGGGGGGGALVPEAVTGGPTLGPEQRRIVRRADTFFIAT